MRTVSGPYTGIIKCLPKKWLDDVGGEKYLDKVFRHNLPKGDWMFYMSLAGKPKYEILHCYLLINGLLRFRTNVAEILPGGTMVFRDRPIPQTWTAKYWAILTAPVIEPAQQMPMTGFQGFRYTEGLF